VSAMSDKLQFVAESRKQGRHRKSNLNLSDVIDKLKLVGHKSLSDILNRG
jgi:hypothetical protein